MIKACVFDCDGTLLDTLKSIAYCANRALRDFGFSEFETERYKQFVGDGAATLIRRCLKNAGDAACSAFPEVFARYREYFAVDCMYEVKPYEGITETVARLRERGIACAVLSNKPHAETRRVIADTFAEGMFDCVQGQMEGLAIKPAPDGALRICGILGVTGGECLYVGDTGTDMKTGNRAGMHTVGVLWGFRGRQELEENCAEMIIEKPCELLEAAERFSGR